MNYKTSLNEMNEMETNGPMECLDQIDNEIESMGLESLNFYTLMKQRMT